MTNESTKPAVPSAEPQGVIDFGKIMRNYLRHWWLFAICLILSVGCAYIYLKSTPKTYLVKSLIMFNQEEVGGVGKAGSLTSMMNLLGSSDSDYANPENEIMKMSSVTNLKDVVNDLHLQYSYYRPGGFMRPEKNLFPKSPVAINIPQAIIDTIGAATSFKITREKGEKEFTIAVSQKKFSTEVSTPRLPFSVKTPYGTFTITLTQHYDPNVPLDVEASAVSTMDAVDDLLGAINFAYISKKADAVQIDLEQTNIKLGEAIVNAVMAHYNNRRSVDRLAHNTAALEFIDNRLLTIYQELDQEDTKVENYKRDQRIVDPEAEANYIFTRMSALDEQYLQLSTKLENYRLFRDMLTNPGTRDNQIPFTSNELGNSETFGRYLLSYNDMLAERMNLEATAKAGNRQLEVLNRQIHSTRETIIKSLNREIGYLSQSLASMKNELNQRDSRMAGMPEMEHKLLSFERDRVVKNQIYAYLLQKREETNIALSQNEPVGKIIDPAYADSKPVAPRSMFVLLAALVIGLMVPSVGLQMIASANKKKSDDK
ncbi:MAG: hypothetical protein HDS66_02990 [Bacteroidales bacterium]|nr:hypothetical protein [Bacteroidales bacterium]